MVIHANFSGVGSAWTERDHRRSQTCKNVMRRNTDKKKMNGNRNSEGKINMAAGGNRLFTGSGNVFRNTRRNEGSKVIDDKRSKDLL